MKRDLLVSEKEEEPPGSSLSDSQRTIRKPFLEFPVKLPVSFFSRDRQFPCGPSTAKFIKKNYPGVGLKEWNDWKWQVANRITALDELRKVLELSPSELKALVSEEVPIAFSVTPYYLSLLDSGNPDQPLRRSIIPRVEETLDCCQDLADPLAEHEYEVAPGLIHRYPDRVLFLATGLCSAYCRYCTRSRVVGKNLQEGPRERQWKEAIDYIRRHPVVRDVLISGGDPLTLSDASLEWLLSRLRNIPHVEFIRLGTKVPAVLPMRITPELTGMLKKYHPLFMSLHFTHPGELTVESREACARLADAGIPLGSQTVLLKDINDDAKILTELFQKLLMVRVKPYYLYQCDPVRGSSHFRTTVEKGMEIMSRIRGFTSGYAVPTFVVDGPGGGGKIPLFSDPIQSREGDDLLLENYQGKIFRYPDPGGSIDSCRRKT